MKRLRIFFGLLVCVVFTGFIVSGCGPPTNPFPVIGYVVNPMPTPEAEILTVTIEATNASGLSVSQAYTIGALFKPRNFILKDDLVRVNMSVPPYNTYYLKHVTTAGAVLDAWEITKRIVRHDMPDVAALEDSGAYDWWIGKMNVIKDYPDGTVIPLIGTFETTGGAGTFEAVILAGFTLSSVEGSAYMGASKACVIDTGNNTVRGSSLVGIPSIGITLALAADDNNVFVGSTLDLSADYLPNMMRSITVLDNDGNYVLTIFSPDVAKKQIQNLAAAGGRVYAGMSDNALASSANGDLRIYKDNGDEVSYSPIDLDLGGPLAVGGIASNRSGLAVKALNPTTNKVYLVNGTRDKVAVITAEAATYNVSVITPPISSSTNGIRTVIPIGNNGKYAVAGGNEICIYDSTDALVARITSEGDAAGSCMPDLAIDNPNTGRLYIAMNPDNSNRIWVVSYEGTATFEAPIDVYADITPSPVFSFTIAKNLNKLFVTVPILAPHGRIVGVDLVNRSTTYYDEGGCPISIAYVESTNKLYVGDVGTSELSVNDLIAPPEKFGYKVKVINPSPLGSAGEINVGYFPGVTYIGNKLIAVASANPGYFSDSSSWEMTFYSTEPPSIENVCVNGGKLVPIPGGDHISSNGVLTADLRDNSAILSAEVFIDGAAKACTFSPTLPANLYTKLSCNTGQLSSGYTHSITIEDSDGVAITTWSISELHALPSNEALTLSSLAVFPPVFKPTKGIPDASGKTTLRFAYNLTIDAPITIMMVDVTGKAVYTRKFNAGTLGGRAGYNEVGWDGKSDTGGTVANGIYPYKIISNGKIIASGKVVVYE